MSTWIRVFSKHLLTAICAVIFVAGVTKYSAARLPQNANADANNFRAFTLTSSESSVDSDGTKKVHALRVLEVDSKGNQTLTKYSLNQAGRWTKTEVTNESITRSDSDGQMTATPQPYDSQKMAEIYGKWRDETYYRNSPNLIRTEMILGLEAFVLRTPLGQDQWIEAAHSPKTGSVALRFIKHRSDGRKIVIEPIKIEFK